MISIVGESGRQGICIVKERGEWLEVVMKRVDSDLFVTAKFYI